MRDSAAAPSFSATEVARLYDFPPDLDGTGQCVGLLELGGGYQEADLQAYMAGLGLPFPAITRCLWTVRATHPEGLPVSR
jgi:kumamolisin